MPEGVLYCKITGRLRVFGNTGPDGMPVFVGAKGEGIITCNAPVIRNTNPAGEQETYLSEPVLFSIDANGYISHAGLPYVMLMAPTLGLNPPDFNYRIRYKLDNGKRYGPFNFDVVPGGELDVANLLIVRKNEGVPVVQGPPGPPGPPGQPGSGAGSDAGLQYVVQTPLSTWIIPIPTGMTRRPSVSVYNELGEEVETDITVTADFVSIHFATPFAGTAVLN